MISGLMSEQDLQQDRKLGSMCPGMAYNWASGQKACAAHSRLWLSSWRLSCQTDLHLELGSLALGQCIAGRGSRDAAATAVTSCVCAISLMSSRSRCEGKQQAL